MDQPEFSHQRRSADRSPHPVLCPACTESAATAAANIGPGTAPHHWGRIRCVPGWATADFVYEPSVHLDGARYIFRADGNQWTQVSYGTGSASLRDLGGMPRDACLQLFDDQRGVCTN